jgi:hypothetical protein
MTLTVAPLRQGTRVSAETGANQSDWSADRLLSLLEKHLPYNLRPTAAGGRLAMMAAIPPMPGLDDRRRLWLTTLTLSTAASLHVPEHQSGEGRACPEGTGRERLDMVCWLAAGKGWRALGDTDAEVRLAVEGEPDYPPICVRPFGADLLIERPLPLLPLRAASARLRVASVHAALALNRRLLFARVATPDRAALTFAVENRLPADADEDEAEYFLEAVRHGARHAHAVLGCLRNEAVAVEYATARNLPGRDADREQNDEV